MTPFTCSFCQVHLGFIIFVGDVTCMCTLDIPKSVAVDSKTQIWHMGSGLVEACVTRGKSASS